MSLHRLLRLHASELRPIEERFCEASNLNRNAPLLVAPPTDYREHDYLLAGLAFIYWLRGYLVRQYGARDDVTSLEMLLDIPSEVADDFGVLDLDAHTGARPDGTEASLRECLQTALQDRRRMVDDGADMLSDAFIDNCGTLGQFEAIFRINNPLENPSASVIDDVRAMAEVAMQHDAENPGTFMERERRILNPWFPLFEELQGTDADLALDDVVVSVTASTEITPPLFMVTGAAYLALEHIEADQRSGQPRFFKIGFYAARFGTYVEIDPYTDPELRAATVRIGNMLLAHRRPSGDSAYDGCLMVAS